MKAIIFDLDGTLVHSAPDIHAAANVMLAHAGRDPVTLDQVIGFIGNGIEKLVERCLRATGGVPDDLTPHYARTLAEWRRRFDAREDEIAALGMTRPERRKWRYYFSYCEGAFLERSVAVAHLLYAKPGNRRNAAAPDRF